MDISAKAPSSWPTVRRVLATGVVGVALLCTTGCGAAMSTYLILRAQAELDGAEAAEAEKYAPYEYRAANEYLHKSREEQGHADFGPSIEYAFKAQELAEKGRSRAEQQRKQLEPPPGDPASVIEDDAPMGGGGQQIIIEKKPQAADPGPTEPAPVEVEIVPITPEEPQ